MLANVFTKTIRDRSVGILIGVFSVGVMLIFGMAVYRDVDVSFYRQLPSAFVELMGIPSQGGVGGLSLGAMYDFIGAFVLGGLAISMGASAIAGEEQEGSLGLLLGNPVSRRGVLISKTLSMVVVIALGSLVLWGFAVLTPIWLDIEMTGLHIPAMVFALFLNSLVYGTLALAIGSCTGNRGSAAGAPVALMVVGYLAAALFPMTESLGWVARIFPWHYYAGSHPLINGVDWGDATVLAGLGGVFIVVGVVGVGRRDLKEKGVGVTILDRLRQNPRTRKMMDRIAGSARLSRISVKTASESQALLVITGAIVFYMGLMMGPLYGFIPDGIKDFVRDFPDALIAMIGGADMSTAAGFLQAEVFSITVPIAFIVLAAAMGGRAIAGEEERHTMGLLLSNPITRSRVVVEKTLAMMGHAFLLGLLTFVGTWLGVVLGGLDLTIEQIGATSLLATLLGLVFGGLALMVGAATGRSRLAAGVTAGVAVVTYFVWSFFPLSPAFEGWVGISPFHYYLGSEPLVNGMDWSDAGVLAMVFIVLVGLSIPLFRRRDLRG